MKIAVPTINGEVAPDFGKAVEFTVFTTSIFDEIEEKHTISAPGDGHESAIRLLTEADVQAIICGGIGGYAVRALKDTSMMLMGGADGLAEDRVNDFLNGQLRFYDMSEPKPARPADGEAEGAGDGALTDGNIAACHP